MTDPAAPAMTAAPDAASALAAALKPHHGPSYFPGLHDVTIIAKTPEDAADAILAALAGGGWRLVPNDAGGGSHPPLDVNPLSGDAWRVKLALPAQPEPFYPPTGSTLTGQWDAQPEPGLRAALEHALAFMADPEGLAHKRDEWRQMARAALAAAPPALDVEALRMRQGWPTPISMRRAADALDILTHPRFGEVLRWVADLCDNDQEAIAAAYEAEVE